MNNLKTTFYPLWLALFFIIVVCVGTISCNKQPTYYLSYKAVTESNNIYNEAGRLEKVMIKRVSSNPYGRGSDYNEDWYYYDSRDSLVEIKSYSIYLETNSKKISRIAYFTDSTYKYILYREYPNDTMFYTFQKKDRNGNIIEEHSKDRILDIESDKIEIAEARVSHQYDKDGRLMSSIEKDIIENTDLYMHFKYYSSNDTTYTNSYEKDILVRTSKKYKAKDVVVEVSESVSPYYVDSIFHISKNRIRSVSYDGISKRMDEFDYDEKGNEIKSIYEVWDIKK